MLQRINLKRHQKKITNEVNAGAMNCDGHYLAPYVHWFLRKMNGNVTILGK